MGPNLNNNAKMHQNSILVSSITCVDMINHITRFYYLFCFLIFIFLKGELLTSMTTRSKQGCWHNKNTCTHCRMENLEILSILLRLERCLNHSMFFTLVLAASGVNIRSNCFLLFKISAKDFRHILQDGLCVVGSWRCFYGVERSRRWRLPQNGIFQWVHATHHFPKTWLAIFLKKIEPYQSSKNQST